MKTIKEITRIVLFNEPIEEEIKGPEPEERGKFLTHVQIQEIVAEAKHKGFGDGAIVVRRGQQFYEMRQPSQWGVVRDLKTFRNGGAPYIPLFICWLKNGDTEYLWPEDLMVVHPAVEWSDMDKRFRAQM